MRHYKQIRKFNRPASQRKALIAGLGRSLILRERIKTTEAKAKELRPYVERLITYGKRGTLADHRRLIAKVGDEAASKLINDVASRYKDRFGGYSRIIKLPPRAGDGAPMAYIELV